MVAALVGVGHLGQTRPVVRYLTPAWVDALATAIATDEAVQAAADSHCLGITQVIAGGPDGTTTYHVATAAGRAEAGVGPAKPEHVRFEQDWDTAVAVAQGTLNAQEAFITGRIRFRGDHEALIAGRALLLALDDALAGLRARTDYR